MSGVTATLNFDWITPALAVGAHIPAGEVETLARDHGVAAVVDARAEAVDDEAAMAAHGIAFLHLPTDDHFALEQDDLDRGVAWVNAHLDAGRRVLIHCQHGVGRSALLALCVLVARGEAPLDALERAKAARWQVSPSQHQFEGWVKWLARHRAATDAAWDVPDYDRFGRIAYRHLARR